MILPQCCSSHERKDFYVFSVISYGFKKSEAIISETSFNNGDFGSRNHRHYSLSNQLLYTDNSIETVKVGLVADASSNYAKMAYSMVADMDSYRTTCEFVEAASESTGEQMLQSGEIKALIVIPDNIINSIMYGEDNPITVMYNEDGTLETHTLNEVFKSTSSMLATAQAATTIIYRTAYNLNLPADVLSAISSETDSMYLDYVFEPNGYFYGHGASCHRKLQSISILYCIRHSSALIFQRNCFSCFYKRK